MTSSVLHNCISIFILLIMNAYFEINKLTKTAFYGNNKYTKLCFENKIIAVKYNYFNASPKLTYNKNEC